MSVVVKVLCQLVSKIQDTVIFWLIIQQGIAIYWRWHYALNIIRLFWRYRPRASKFCNGTFCVISHDEFTLSTLRYVMLRYVTIHYTFIILHYIALHYITLHYITLHYITLHYITLHYITLHYITLHYNITLHYISLHCMFIPCMYRFWNF